MSKNNPCYRHEKWLRTKYVKERVPTTKMAELAGCDPSTITKWMDRYGIERRNMSKAKTKDKPYTSRYWLHLNYVKRGQSTSDLADACGCTRSTIRFWLRRHGINTRAAGGISEYDIDMRWLREQYEDHEKTIQEIADRVGCHPNTICHHLHQIGVNTRTQKGPNHYNWKGGISPLHETIRKCDSYLQWKDRVFQRDHYTCQWCGQKGGELHADHIYPFSYILEDYSIQSLEQARECVDLWDIDNGRTLCFDCHRATPTYGESKRYGDVQLRKLDIKAKLLRQKE